MCQIHPEADIHLPHGTPSRPTVLLSSGTKHNTLNQLRTTRLANVLRNTCPETSQPLPEVFILG
jgi:hypothetical protein